MILENAFRFVIFSSEIYTSGRGYYNIFLRGNFLNLTIELITVALYIPELTL